MGCRSSGGTWLEGHPGAVTQGQPAFPVSCGGRKAHRAEPGAGQVPSCSQLATPVTGWRAPGHLLPSFTWMGSSYCPGVAQLPWPSSCRPPRRLRPGPHLSIRCVSPLPARIPSRKLPYPSPQQPFLWGLVPACLSILGRDVCRGLEGYNNPVLAAALDLEFKEAPVSFFSMLVFLSCLSNAGSAHRLPW